MYSSYKVVTPPLPHPPPKSITDFNGSQSNDWRSITEIGYAEHSCTARHSLFQAFR